MFENKIEENIVEQNPESAKNTVSGVSVEDAPAISNDNLEQNKDYLDPKLFDDIKVIKIPEDDKNESLIAVDQKVEELYANTFGDISENTLVEGRVVGMNDRDVLIDIGSVVFPKADFKFFLTADIDIRSQRRKNELEKIGEDLSIDEIKASLEKRDLIDSSRDVSPLKRPEDSIEIDSTNLTIDEQIEKIMKIIKNNK